MYASSASRRVSGCLVPRAASTASAFHLSCEPILLKDHARSTRVGVRPYVSCVRHETKPHTESRLPLGAGPFGHEHDRLSKTRPPPLRIDPRHCLPRRPAVVTHVVHLVEIHGVSRKSCEDRVAVWHLSTTLRDVSNIPSTACVRRSGSPLGCGLHSGCSSVTVGWLRKYITRPATARMAGWLSLVRTASVWPMLSISLATNRTSSGATSLLLLVCADQSCA